MEITQNLVITIYKGNGFFVKIVLFNPSLFFFFAIRNMKLLIWERMHLFFFFPVKKVAFFHSSFSKLLLLQ